MSQITIYLDDASEAAAREAAARANLSVSRWFAQFAEAEKARRNNDWTDYWEEVDRSKASWAEFPLTEEMNRDSVEDSQRESL